MENIVYTPIGLVETPFNTIQEMPIQPCGGQGVKGRIILKTEFVDALTDLEAFSHIIVLYHFHKSKNFNPIVVPFLDNRPHGLFSTRAPRRPNPIGISVSRLERIEGNILDITDVDMLNGTPVLDIKPYVPEFDHHKVDRIGWLENNVDRTRDTSSDDRFG